ncbi:MAG: arsenate reductase ArsC [Bacteroidota bacterium]|nr:arsenate reductase ArsC [Bacteroidota bacterium]
MRKRVLLLCTANSCRSQMAEGIVRHELGSEWDAFSAGTRPGIVNPYAVLVMNEIGIDISGQASKHVDEFSGREFDLVITLCGEAAEECPLWLGLARKMHIPFDDPAKAVGSEEEILSAFRRVRNEIRERIPPVLKTSRPVFRSNGSG